MGNCQRVREAFKRPVAGLYLRLGLFIVYCCSLLNSPVVLSVDAAAGDARAGISREKLTAVPETLIHQVVQI